MSDDDGPLSGRTVRLTIGAVIVAIPIAAYSLQLAAGLKAIEEVDRRVSDIKMMLCEEPQNERRHVCQGGRD